MWGPSKEQNTNNTGTKHTVNTRQQPQLHQQNQEQKHTKQWQTYWVTEEQEQRQELKYTANKGMMRDMYKSLLIAQILAIRATRNRWDKTLLQNEVDTSQNDQRRYKTKIFTTNIDKITKREKNGKYPVLRLVSCQLNGKNKRKQDKAVIHPSHHKKTSFSANSNGWRPTKMICSGFSHSKSLNKNLLQIKMIQRTHVNFIE